MEMYKHRALEILHRSLIPFLVVFRQFRAFVLNGFENIEEKLELAALPTAPHLTGKNVMVTGAGGLIGSEVVRQLIQFQPSHILLLGHGPQSIYSVDYELRKLLGRHTEIIPIVLDIQDKKRISSIIGRYKPDIIYHTDGRQQLDVTEDSSEPLYANVFGTRNIAEAANRHQIERFVLISSELAEKPRNLMEAEKSLSEMVVESISLTSLTRYTIIRLPGDGSAAIKPKKPYGLSDKKMADAQLVQRILQTDSLAPTSVLNCLKKSDSSPSTGFSQIEMARLLKQLKTATENEARQLVISFLKR